MRDTDLAARGFQLQAIVWALAVGSAGILIGILVSYMKGWPVVRTLLGGFLWGRYRPISAP